MNQKIALPLLISLVGIVEILGNATVSRAAHHLAGPPPAAGPTPVSRPPHHVVGHPPVAPRAPVKRVSLPELRPPAAHVLAHAVRVRSIPVLGQESPRRIVLNADGAFCKTRSTVLKAEFEAAESALAEIAEQQVAAALREKEEKAQLARDAAQKKLEIQTDYEGLPTPPSTQNPPAVSARPPQEIPPELRPGAIRSLRPAVEPSYAFVGGPYGVANPDFVPLPAAVRAVTPPAQRTADGYAHPYVRLLGASAPASGHPSRSESETD